MDSQNFGGGGGHFDAHMHAHMHAHNAAMEAQNLHLAAVDQHAYGHQAYGAHAGFAHRRSSSHSGHNHVHSIQQNALVLQALPGIQSNAAINRTKYAVMISGLIVGGLYGGLIAVNTSSGNSQVALVVIEVAFLLIIVTNILMAMGSAESIKRNHACIAKTCMFTFTLAIVLHLTFECEHES